MEVFDLPDPADALDIGYDPENDVVNSFSAILDYKRINAAFKELKADDGIGMGPRSDDDFGEDNGPDDNKFDDGDGSAQPFGVPSF